jgi:putative transposase
MQTLTSIRRRGPGYCALRRGRHSLPSQVYLLTTTTQCRRPIFLDFHAAHAACRTLSQPALWRSSTLLCWVLMPDHWHGIVELGSYEPVEDLMRRVKCVTAAEVNRDRRAYGSVWASGFHDHALRYEEDVVGVSRYVIENPVRAGLVRRALDYPFWDAVWMDGASAIA